MSPLRIALLLFISQSLAHFTTPTLSNHIKSDLTPPATEDFLRPFGSSYPGVPNLFSSERRDHSLDLANMQVHQAAEEGVCAKDTQTVYCTAGSRREKPEVCVCPGCFPDGTTCTGCPPTTVVLDAIGRRTICRTKVIDLTTLHPTRQLRVGATVSTVSKPNGDLDILSDLGPIPHKITAFPTPTGTSRQHRSPEELKAALLLFGGVGQACGSGGFECIKGTNTVCCASGQACNSYDDCLCPGCCPPGASCTPCPPTTVFTMPAGDLQTTCKTVPASAVGISTPPGLPGQAALQRDIVKPFARAIRGHEHAYEHLYRRNDTASSSGVTNHSNGGVLPTLWFTTTTTSTVTVSSTIMPLATAAPQVCSLRRKLRA